MLMSSSAQIQRRRRRLPQRRIQVAARPDHLAAEVSQHLLDIHRNQKLVLDDEDSSRLQITRGCQTRHP
jgi:hypothetical protein